MKTIIKLKLSQGRITQVKVQPDGCYEFVVESEESVDAKLQKIFKTETSEGLFSLIEASKLSLKDKFMKYKPKTQMEKKLKELLEQVIKGGVKDFWRPSLDPSFTDDKAGICYVAGKEPAVGKSYNWWNKTAKEYNPNRCSRLGTKSEYVAFLGVLIKALVSEGWTITAAWNAVCNDSKELGHYWNSENALHNFEPTGSRAICGFFDLANTCKILAEDEEAGGFWLAGGNGDSNSYNFPLAGLYHYSNQFSNYNISVGWLVLEEGSTDH